MQRTKSTKKQVIKFRKAKPAITKAVNKLGGQPVWLDKPQWPVGTTGEPMRFICQVEINCALPQVRGKMAYIFFNDDPICAGYGNPDEGDCAVIIQPGGKYTGPTVPLPNGPSVYRRVWRDGVERRYPVEFAMDLSPRDEDMTTAWEDTDPEDKHAWSRYFNALCEEKIGGRAIRTVDMLDAPLPIPRGWNLLIQLHSRDDGSPFFLNMAGDGTGYAFVSPDGNRGKFWFDR
jgi:hypothetical protein